MFGFILWIVINNENAKLLKLHLNTKEFFDFADAKLKYIYLPKKFAFFMKTVKK